MDNQPTRIDSARIFVSIYLFLVIFFIVINTINNVAGYNSSAFIESINKTFAQKTFFNKSIKEQDRETNVVEFDTSYEDLLRKNVNEIFGHIYSDELERDDIDDSNFISMDVPVYEIFKNSDVINAATVDGFFTQLKSFLENNEKVELNITLGIQKENIQRMLNLHKKLLSYKIDDRKFKVGLSTQEKDLVFSFHLLT